jgi:glyoxylase-like metal-dependent hydrolase (beta-lactamase superfamily II)
MPFAVTTSRMRQTNATVLAHGGETLVVDAPYFPDELEALRATVFGPVRLFATHSHFDHLLSRLAFPDVPLLLGMPTAQALAADPERPSAALRDADARHYVRRDEPLRFGAMQGVPVPGEIDLGGEWVELIAAPGHAADGTVLFAPWLGVLCVGDLLSDVEIPSVSAAGSVTEYRETLERQRPLVGAASTVVPGHGAPADARIAGRRLDDDLRYLEGLGAGDPGQRLPSGRDTPRQREIHLANLKHTAPPPKPKPKPRAKKK